ncbi:MAG: hypothetical protein HY080_02485 [Gammaproteobacteria bacterium]|nr:hypothetical protein [Gammaproteobacteria bacterium]
MKSSTLNDELLQSKEKFLSGENSAELLSALRAKFPDMTDDVFIIGWIPEQGEDIYTVLVNGNKVVEVEISRISPAENPVSFVVLTVQEYLKKNPALSKSTRRKLDGAIQLSQKHKI